MSINENTLAGLHDYSKIVQLLNFMSSCQGGKWNEAHGTKRIRTFPVTVRRKTAKRKSIKI